MTAPTPDTIAADVTAFGQSQYAAGVAQQQLADQAQIASLQAQLATAEGEIDALEAQLAQAGGRLVLGLDTANNSAASKGIPLATRRLQVCAAYGRSGLGPHVKYFDGGKGWAAAQANMINAGYGTDPSETEPVLCSKQVDVAGFNAVATAMGKQGKTWWACYWQEIQDDIRDGHITAAAYRDGWAQLAGARKAHPSGSLVKFLPIMNGYVLETQTAQCKAGGYDTVALLQGVECDAVGTDYYDGSGYPASWSAAQHFVRFAADAHTLGKPYAIPEFGVTASAKGDTPLGVAVRLAEILACLAADPNCLWANYWEDGAWSVIGTPAQGVLLGALATN